MADRMNGKRIGTPVLGIAAAAVLVVLAGCKSEEIMKPRPFVPAAGDVMPADENAVKAPVKPAPAPQEEILPMETIESVPLTQSAPASGDVYVVQKGDTLAKIASRCGVSVNRLAEYNNVNPNKIYAGKKLYIPGKNSPKVSDKAAKSGKAVSASAGKSTAAAAERPADGLYTVRSGDSLDKISRRYHVKIDDLMQANGLTSSRLRVGQKLKIPAPGTTVAAPAPAAAPAVSAPAASAASLDADLDKVVNTLDNSAAVPAAAPAPAVTAPEAPAAASAPAAVPEVATLNVASTPMEVAADTTVDALAAQYHTTAEALRQANPDLPKDNQLKAGTIVFVPSAQ